MLQHTGNTWLNFRTSFVNTFEFWQPDHKTRPKSWIILKMCHRNFLDDTTQLNNEKITLWRKDTIKSSKASLTWAQGKGKNQFICFVLFWASWNSEPWFHEQTCRSQQEESSSEMIFHLGQCEITSPVPPAALAAPGLRVSSPHSLESCFYWESRLKLQQRRSTNRFCAEANET